MNASAGFAGQELAALAALGIDSRPRKNKPCPACGGRDRFSLKADGGHYCRQCGHGDFLDLIQKVYRCDFKEALAMVEDGVGAGQLCPAPVLLPVVDDDARKLDRARRIVSESEPIGPGSNPFKYLTQSRGFPASLIPPELLSHESLDYWHETDPGKHEVLGRYSAMVAPVRSLRGEVIAAHITYLLDGQKAPVPSPKKLVGRPRGGMVRLYPAGEKLGIAEGNETAIAASALSSLPVWAALSASLMPSIEVPVSVDELYLFADNDSNQAGQKAANQLVRRLIAERRKVRAPIAPTFPDSDFFDLWRHINEQSDDTSNDTNSATSS